MESLSCFIVIFVGLNDYKGGNCCSIDIGFIFVQKNLISSYDVALDFRFILQV